MNINRVKTINYIKELQRNPFRRVHYVVVGPAY